MNDLVLRKVLQRTGRLPFSTPQIKRMEAAGKLPKPIQVTERIFAYRRDEFDVAEAALTRGTI